jgi:hypothetical protein
MPAKFVLFLLIAFALESLYQTQTEIVVLFIAFALFGNLVSEQSRDR